MNWLKRSYSPQSALSLLVLFSLGGLVVGQAPQPAAPSAFVSTDDLAAQLAYYTGRVEEGLTSADEFEALYTRVTKDANTLIVLALTLGLHDQDHPQKAAAAEMMQAAQALAKAEDDYEAAQEAFAKFQAASGSGGAGDLAWERVASLGQLMKQVTFVDNRLKRSLRRFGRRNEESAGDAALLAVIANASMYDTHEVKDPENLDKWYHFCAEMRDIAAELSDHIKANDEEASNETQKRLAQNCDDCHAVFRPDL